MLISTGCALSGPEATPVPTSTPAMESVKVNTIVVKMVERPADRDRDFQVIRLDGSYTVTYDPTQCMTDDKPYMYGPYDSVQHCWINEPDILQSIGHDQSWLDPKLQPLQKFVRCIHGWVYQGIDVQTQEKVWFVEMFGFTVCG